MKDYPTHKAIAAEVEKLVSENINHESAHNRENLDDLISDLIQFRNTLPSVNEYKHAGKL